MERGLNSVYGGKRVFVTGHTGFKGSWLCEWLLALGARVTGYSLPPAGQPALFDLLSLRGRMERHIEADILNLPRLRREVAEAAPDFVFHMAAQPLVRDSYDHPVETFNVNVMGTAHVLESLRQVPGVVAVCVTTDKCYENREWVHGYREEDPVGGHDPYSASKACAELVIASYRRSFLKDAGARVASVRAGNVIGGGDWAKDRIVPDSVRSLMRGAPIMIRRPNATRPWQHVLDPLAGYLWLAARLRAAATADSPLCSAFNFGPNHESNRPVRDLVEGVLKIWPGSWETPPAPEGPHEAALLHLSTDKARALLGWAPVWNFEESVYRTISWYRLCGQNPGVEAVRSFTLGQIDDFIRDAAAKKLPWVQ